MILLDTNIISEIMRPEPAPSVRNWFARQSPVDMYLSTVTLAEIGYGLHRLPEGRRRDGLMRQADRLFAEDFAGRVFSFDESAAVIYGPLTAKTRQAGWNMAVEDLMIAAIAMAHGAAVATRNLRDFQHTGLTVQNPFEG
ncbi:type II toxin-antitoxin system VapC family toxin [Sulfitobacter mediterraneus]|uniref:type II toxin-antitoxin system VapC family toxin n=1 Tax=Sulfitobacter mediterraneus TaxID=83219 RepID=UPI0021A9009A|nr:type II toxin-antitoxin system VapC family toxin [Sulfitobacter mediterraneus]UWR13592.1 type II toxin-antitoxin system VapC family toxin [Sulfitobacter mediterraneus]